MRKEDAEVILSFFDEWMEYLDTLDYPDAEPEAPSHARTGQALTKKYTINTRRSDDPHPGRRIHARTMRAHTAATGK